MTHYEDHAPVSIRYRDRYFSDGDPLAEKRWVFLDGAGVAERFESGGEIVVLELGFGSGILSAATLELWSRRRTAHGTLHLITIEGFLLRPNEVAHWLERFPDIAPFGRQLTSLVNEAHLTGETSTTFVDGLSARITLIPHEIARALHELPCLTEKVDVVYFDGFSPSLNPEMWCDSVVEPIARLMPPGSVVATYTVSGEFRRALRRSGITPQLRPGWGRKRHVLNGVRDS